MSNRFAVCLCVDARMLIPALFVAQSVMANRTGEFAGFDLIVVTPPADADEAARDWMAQRGILHCDDLDTSAAAGIEVPQGRLSPATLTKLFLAPHFAVRYDRILYLDADLTVHDDVTALFALDTGDFPLAAVPSGRIWDGLRAEVRRTAEEHFQSLGMTPPFRFFNSGVLYIDVAKWNRDDLTDRTLAFLRSNGDKCSLPDEHALNGVLDGAIAEISPVWNSLPRKRSSTAQTTFSIPVIVHYMGEDKPWRRFGYHKRLFPDRTPYRLYEGFIKDTPWPDWLDTQWTARDLRANIAWEVRRMTRRIRGKSDERSAAGERAHIDALRRYYLSARFADVEQGIVSLDDGVLRLKHGGRTAT